MEELDAQLVPPARLKLTSLLSGASEIEFATLREALGASDSVLSKHLGALEEAGYVRRRKGMHAGRRTTWVALTARGRRALRAHVAALRAMIEGVD